MDTGDEEALRVEPVGTVGPSETQGRESAAGLALSVLLHGIALCLLLVVGGCAAIAQTGISTSQQITALIVLIAIGTIGVSAPVVIYFAMGTRATSILQNLKTWMVTNNAVIMTILCLIIGVKLLGDGISGLSS